MSKKTIKLIIIIFYNTLPSSHTRLSPKSISLLVTFNGNNWRANWLTVNEFSTFEVVEDSNAAWDRGVYKIFAIYEK